MEDYIKKKSKFTSDRNTQLFRSRQNDTATIAVRPYKRTIKSVPLQRNLARSTRILS